MGERKDSINRRDFLKGAAYAGLAATVGLPLDFVWADDTAGAVKVVLIRDQHVIDADGNISAEIMQSMIDQAVAALYDTENHADAWKQIVKPDDIVGIKSNEWGPLPTPSQLEQAIKTRVMEVGVAEDKLSIKDRGVLSDNVFQNATALINARPLRTHHWAGIGGCLKNPIMFTMEPSAYHDDSCADMATFWSLPILKDKVRLNVLVVLTPLFHGTGAHHFDETYTWGYNGLLVSQDPVAIDAVGLHLLNAKRLEYFGEEKPITPPPHHVAYADIRHHLGVSDLSKINLVKLGWDEGVLI
ncbi:MAG: DUF362 domain-containing protein [candidate division Zixibacteria bacterium]|nr:DUF362 domain-containing protein [candidate division Zixibacteria bacterium]